MNITFLIGNGFDLNLGLKTSYKDFYKYYKKKEPKDFIAKSIKSNYELWADLEIGLGQFLKDYTKDDIERFLDSKTQLEKHLIDYLIEENKRVEYIDKEKLSKELRTFVTEISKDFTKKDRRSFDEVMKNSSSIDYKFITFNYTDVLDNIVSCSQKYLKPFSTHIHGNTRVNDTISMPLHVNGSLDNGLILGLDNKFQIDNAQLQDEISLTNYMLKEKLNNELGEYNKETAENIIDNSKIICLFGLSIGNTDDHWWCYLMKWLLKSPNNRLIIFVKDNTTVSTNATSKIRYRDKKRISFSNHNNKLSDAEKDQIHKRTIIIQNSNIFSFSGLKLKPNKDDIIKQEIIEKIKKQVNVSIKNIKDNTPYSEAIIRKYIKELVEEKIITYQLGKHNKKLYKLV